MKKALFVVVLLAVAGGAFWFYQQKPVEVPVETEVPVKETVTTSTEKKSLEVVVFQKTKELPSRLSAVVLAGLDAQLEEGGKENSSGQSMKKNFCDGKETGTLSDYDYTIYSADLNGDGVVEFVVEPYSICDSTEFFRGASNNGPYLVYAEQKGVWRMVGNLFGNSLQILDTLHGRYRDLKASAHLSVDSETTTVYHWNDKMLQYEEVVE